ncbi:hypothetical protein N7495_000384 [Penicillium taxi]|uniref:uncharacterized protein n=1 Tax=Penicillium taxi TaxID=168475 RepID=UPI002545ADAF|nr:uncharacterized protein N7495_000384 [Penicillium taxi]KAJ5907702.1 hypothetical protein N7495_000384 [Penicillium taxi]
MSEIASESIPAVPASDEYYDLGNFSRKITTASPDAQIWFNRGLTWAYSFNHAEAAYCFEQATIHDPSCAMAQWGLSFALGPSYNKPWEKFDPDDLKKSVYRSYHASRKANELATHSTPIERALIDAIQFRYQTDHTRTDLKGQNKAYVRAMELVYHESKDDVGTNDLDVAALYADSLMNLTPWSLWNLFTGKPNPLARTMDVKQVLETTFTQPGAIKHPGLLHLYIHYIEMSPTPEIGIAIADNLRDLVPDAGHMRHMPTHLDILVGDWQRSIASNHVATIADEKFFHRAGAFNFYTFYRMHNYHSLISSAMFAGQLNTALDAVTRMEATLPEEVLRIQSPPMADWLENFLTSRIHVMIRFGQWSDLITMDLPADKELYSVVTATAHYAKGVAFSATGQIPEAEAARNEFRKALDKVPESRIAYNSTCVQVLTVASKMLDGEIEYRRAEYESAFSSLSKAVALDDKLPYSEPWAWMQPTRHAYAALLLERGLVEDALAVYKADLGIDDTLIRAARHPNNVWALQGFYECLVRLGRVDEAGAVEPTVRLALDRASVTIKSSCFCRLDTSLAPDFTSCCD